MVNQSESLFRPNQRICSRLSNLNDSLSQASQGTYVPYDKEWIKEKTYVLLRKQVEGDA